jgi:hypothetical protein
MSDEKAPIDQLVKAVVIADHEFRKAVYAEKEATSKVAIKDDEMREYSNDLLSRVCSLYPNLDQPAFSETGRLAYRVERGAGYRDVMVIVQLASDRATSGEVRPADFNVDVIDIVDAMAIDMSDYVIPMRTEADEKADQS